MQTSEAFKKWVRDQPIVWDVRTHQIAWEAWKAASLHAATVYENLHKAQPDESRIYPHQLGIALLPEMHDEPGTQP